MESAASKGCSMRKSRAAVRLSRLLPCIGPACDAVQPKIDDDYDDVKSRTPAEVKLYL